MRFQRSTGLSFLLHRKFRMSILQTGNIDRIQQPCQGMMIDRTVGIALHRVPQPVKGGLVLTQFQIRKPQATQGRRILRIATEKRCIVGSKRHRIYLAVFSPTVPVNFQLKCRNRYQVQVLHSHVRRWTRYDCWQRKVPKFLAARIDQ